LPGKSKVVVVGCEGSDTAWEVPSTTSGAAFVVPRGKAGSLAVPCSQVISCPQQLLLASTTESIPQVTYPGDKRSSVSVTCDTDAVKQESLKTPAAFRGEKTCKCMVQYLKENKTSLI